MRFLLDTDTCIYATKRTPKRLAERLARTPPGDLAMSAITYFELSYGAFKSRHPEMNLANLELLRARISVVPLDENMAEAYGRLRAELERKGTPIGAHDLLIAAQAVTLGVTLVTNNVREFSRIRNLKVENWAAGS